MFQTDLLFLAKLIDPDMFLFFAFGFVTVPILLLRTKPLIKQILVNLVVLEILFVWKVILGLAVPAIHFVPEKFELLAVLFIWHRWILLAPIPILLAMAFIVLVVYRERITETHAVVYRHLTIFSVLAAFVLFAISVVESIF